MKLLIVHMRYEPDPTGTAPLVTQLAQDLVQNDVEVVVIASLPHYGRQSVHPDYQQYQGFFHRNRENGVEIFRTPIFVPRKPGLIGRALNYLSYNLNSILAGLLIRDVDIILAINPPITTTFSAWIMSIFHRIPLIVGIQDVWPDCVIQVGQLKNRVLIFFSKIMEKIQYMVADKVIVLSQGMKENLLRKGVRTEKIAVIANWADPDAVIPLPKDNAFYLEQNLGDYFVVLFAGNHGYNAALEYVIEAAEHLKDHSDILFIFAGEGSVKQDLVKSVNNKNLINIRFLPTLPYRKWLEMLAAADLTLVTLREDLAELNVPSKVYTLMSASRPIAASVPVNSEVGKLIRTANCGIVSPPEDPLGLVETILDCKQGKYVLEDLGRNGREYLVEFLHRNQQTGQYLNLLKSSIGGREKS